MCANKKKSKREIKCPDLNRPDELEAARIMAETVEKYRGQKVNLNAMPKPLNETYYCNQCEDEFELKPAEGGYIKPIFCIYCCSDDTCEYMVDIFCIDCESEFRYSKEKVPHYINCTNCDSTNIVTDEVHLRFKRDRIRNWRTNKDFMLSINGPVQNLKNPMLTLKQRYKLGIRLKKRMENKRREAEKRTKENLQRLKEESGKPTKYEKYFLILLVILLLTLLMYEFMI